ncbi:Protein DA1-related 1 [Morella rubra]|uniref:Protein DA1-related 1 n=1 Tax=Morella rubra TaxID=262757 RepID=A0A6A1URK2_9ROSI|nr:Protein DA1-related 1 [Morella rubra]
MTKLGAGKSLPTNWGITFCPMDWLTELLRGSSPSGQYHGKHPDESIWDEARNSVDELTDIEREEIDCAIALSLSEEDHKGKKLIGKLHGLSVLTLNMIQLSGEVCSEVPADKMITLNLDTNKV